MGGNAPLQQPGGINVKSPIFFSVVRWLEGGFAVIRLSFTEEHIHTLQNLCWFHIRRSVFPRVLSPRDTHTHFSSHPSPKASVLMGLFTQ